MQESSFQSPINQFNYSSPETPKKSGKKFVFLILFLVILVIGIIVGKNMIAGSGEKKENPETTPTPTEYQFPTDTPTPSPTSEVEEKPTISPTTKTVNPVDSSTGLDRSTLTVEIQNGSGVTGAAAKGADVLRSFGYKIGTVGNADNSNYANVTIQVKSTKVNFLALLKKDLGFSYTVGSTSADLSSSSTADALVIIGE